MLADYQVSVIDPVTGALLRVYDQTSLIAMRYSRKINDVGALSLSVAGNQANYDTFPLDALIDVRRTNPVTGVLETEATYFARMRQRYIENNEERLAIGGVALNHLLLRRVVNPAADPLAAGGYSTKGGPADTVIEGYVREQAADLASVDRAFPNFTVASSAGIGANAGARARFENLLELIQSLANQGGVDFSIRRTTGAAMEMTIGIEGTDKTRTTNEPLQLAWVGLNPNRGNLSSPVLTEDRTPEQNFVIVLSQGTGRGRQRLSVWDIGINDSPFNRIEYVLDGRNIQRGDTLSMYTEGTGDLLKKRIQLKFDYKPTGGEPGNIYNVDWTLGDKITVLWDSAQKDVRVMSIEIQIDENGETITPTVENIA